MASHVAADKDNPIEVQFTSTQSGTMFYERTDVLTIVSGFQTGTLLGYGYRTICTAPCRAAVSPGSHTFAIAHGNSIPRETGPVVIDPQHTHIYGDYVRRTGTRTAGLVTFGLGASLGAALMIVGATADTQRCQGASAMTNRIRMSHSSLAALSQCW